MFITVFTKARHWLIHPITTHCVIFRTKRIFYNEELLHPRSASKLENHHLSAVRDCLLIKAHFCLCLTEYYATKTCNRSN